MGTDSSWGHWEASIIAVLGAASHLFHTTGFTSTLPPSYLPTVSPFFDKTSCEERQRPSFLMFSSGINRCVRAHISP